MIMSGLNYKTLKALAARVQNKMEIGRREAESKKEQLQPYITCIKKTLMKNIFSQNMDFFFTTSQLFMNR